MDQFPQYVLRRSRARHLEETGMPLPTILNRINHLTLSNMESLNCLDQLSTSTLRGLVRERYIIEDRPAIEWNVSTFGWEWYI